MSAPNTYRGSIASQHAGWCQVYDLQLFLKIVDLTPIANILLVDAVVSQNRVFYVDMRLSNKSDNPQLISAVSIIAKDVESYRVEHVGRVLNEINPISQAYDIDISNLHNPGDILTEPLSQAIQPKSIDRFVLRLHAGPQYDMLQDGHATRYVFDIEITTSVGTIILENQEATFGAGLAYLLDNGYFEELDFLADRRSGKIKQ